MLVHTFPQCPNELKMVDNTDQLHSYHGTDTLKEKNPSLHEFLKLICFFEKKKKKVDRPKYKI